MMTIMGKAYSLTRTKKINSLEREFSIALKKDNETTSMDHSKAFVMTVWHECIQAVEQRLSVEVRPLQLKLCNDAEFKLFQLRFPDAIGATTAFIEQIRGIVFVNLQKLVELNIES